MRASSRWLYSCAPRSMRPLRLRWVMYCMLKGEGVGEGEGLGAGRVLGEGGVAGRGQMVAGGSTVEAARCGHGGQARAYQGTYPRCTPGW